MYKRNSDMALRVRSSAPAKTRTKSPACAPAASAMAWRRSGAKNLSTLLLKVPSALHLINTKPFIPICGRFTHSVNSSVCLRVYSAHPGTAIAKTVSASSNTAKLASPIRLRWSALWGNTWLGFFKLASRISKRMSGLSLPYCHIASSQVIRATDSV